MSAQDEAVGRARRDETAGALACWACGCLPSAANTCSGRFDGSQVTERCSCGWMRVVRNGCTWWLDMATQRHAEDYPTHVLTRSWR